MEASRHRVPVKGRTPDDLVAFKRMSTEPNWNATAEGKDPLSPMLNTHRAYLDSIIADMQQNPGSFGRDAVDAAQPLPLFKPLQTQALTCRKR